MKKILNSQWAVICLIVIAVGSVLQSVALPLIQSSGSKKLVEEVVDPLLDTISSTVKEGLSDNTQSDSNIDVDNLTWIENPKRNPFQTYPEPIKKTTVKKAPKQAEKIERQPVIPPQLEAIIINDTTRYAVLSSEVISLGEAIGEFKIKNIQTDHVDLTGPDGPLRLHLNEPTLEENHAFKK